MTLPDLRPLTLTTGQLEETRDVLKTRIEQGLGEDGRQLRCLPAYLPPPPDDLSGEAVVLDTGGTNMRAALVSVTHGRGEVTHGPIARRLPVREHSEQPLDAERFFQIQAELVAELQPPPGLPVGYCFSYPSEVLSNRDARLIKWSKEIEIPGVVGTLVGTRLKDALRTLELRPAQVRVLNDTVASMLGGAMARQGPDRRNTIGLIAGTGSNMSGFFEQGQAAKLPYGPMAVNLESGNYEPPFLTKWDQEMDEQSDTPNRQRFEKAVAGFYLPYVFQRILPSTPGFEPTRGSRQLVEYRDAQEASAAQQVAAALLTRAADLIAAGLAAVATFYPGPAAVIAEGSLFWGDPQFADRCRDTLRTLSPSTKIFRTQDANLMGSACAALAP